MSAFVIVLRIVALLTFAIPMMLLSSKNRKVIKQKAFSAPVASNIGASTLFLFSLLSFPGSAGDLSSVPFALAGCLIALTGVGLVHKARAELGRAWSLAPAADVATGLVTNGPYRLVRHPIYLGFIMVAAGQALAFSSPIALLFLLFGIVPTFAWRARAEEKLLEATFGPAYLAYRRRTKLLIPGCF